MSDQESRKDSDTTGADAPSPDGYIDHVKQVLSAADEAFSSDRRLDRGHAVIDFAVFFTAVFAAALVGRVTGYAGWEFEFGYVLDAVKTVLTVGIPIAAAIGALHYFASGEEPNRSLDFHIEKFGAGLLLPALFLLGASVLDLLDIRIHTWLRGLSMAFVYVLVFGLAYRSTSPGRLTFAAAFLAGFYGVYRLMALLF